MDSSSGQRIQDGRKNSGKSFSLPGRKFCDFPFMHHQTGQDLGVKGKKPDGSTAGLTDESKAFDEEVIEGGFGLSSSL
jgi:hypothetical protein